MVSYIEDYDEMTVGETKDYLDEQDYSRDQLEDIIAYERANENRTTLLDDLESRLEEDETEDEGDAEAEDADTDADAEPLDAEVESEDAAPGTHHPEGDDEATTDADAGAEDTESDADSGTDVGPDADVETVKVRVLRNYCAGNWYDQTDQVVEVERNQRLEEALDAGECELVEQ